VPPTSPELEPAMTALAFPKHDPHHCIEWAEKITANESRR
jgi:hypothetical protein